MENEIPKFTKKEFSQLKYFIYFALFILIFQTFQYLTTKRTTRKYQDLFSKVTEIVILTNSVAHENSNIHRSLLNITFSSDKLDVQRFRKMLEVAEDKTEESLGLIEKKIASYDIYRFEKTKLFVELKFAEQKYKTCYRKYLDLLKTFTEEQSLQYRRNKIRPLLESFQRDQHAFMIKIFTDQQILTEEIAINAGDTGITLLITGNFILVLVIIFLIYILFSERKKLV